MDERRALLIESHPMLREVLGQLLIGAGLCVDEAEDAVDAVCIAVREKPEFVVLDAATRDASGLALGELICRLVPQSKVILLVDDAHSCSLPPGQQVFACLNKRAVVHELPLLLAAQSHGWTGESPGP